MSAKPVLVSDKPVPVFTSFGKSTTDFFTKGFPAAHKLEISTKAEHGLSFTNSIEKKRKDNHESVLGKLDTKYKHEAYGLELSATVDTENVIKGDISVNKVGGLSGLKLVVKPHVGKAQEVNAGFEFQNKNVSLASSFLYKGSGETSVNFALVGSNGSVSGGFESNYFLRKGNANGFESVRGLLGYKTPSLEVLVTAKNQWTIKEDGSTSAASPTLTFGCGYEHKAGEDTTLHSSLDYDTTKTGGDAVVLKFGGSHKLDSDTSFSTKIDTDFTLGVHLAKQFNSNLKATLTTEFDLFALSGAEHKFAVGVAFKA